ncbi:MAG: hypothetical protein P8O00_04865 [Candidatus Marinimicrobia bacterium]|nr:hypothetical protein [Candidatus Neomarinimicrobiota bacterium]
MGKSLNGLRMGKNLKKKYIKMIKKMGNSFTGLKTERLRKKKNI